MDRGYWLLKSSLNPKACVPAWLCGGFWGPGSGRPTLVWIGQATVRPKSANSDAISGAIPEKARAWHIMGDLFRDMIRSCIFPPDWGRRGWEAHGPFSRSILLHFAFPVLVHARLVRVSVVHQSLSDRWTWGIHGKLHRTAGCLILNITLTWSHITF